MKKTTLRARKKAHCWPENPLYSKYCNFSIAAKRSGLASLYNTFFEAVIQKTIGVTVVLVLEASQRSKAAPHRMNISNNM